MKKAGKILKKLEEEVPFKLLKHSKINPYILEVIKQTQIDAIDSTIKFCAKNAKIKDVEIPLLRGEMYAFKDIDRQGILDFAEILKQKV